MSMADRDSAAKRRRDRRLRMHWRHEQLTLQMALAAALHHSRDVGPVTNNALRSQRTAWAGVWGSEMHNTATIRDPPTPQPELFSLYDKEPGGSRPDRMPTLSGTPSTRLSLPSLRCRLSMFLYRRRWTSWWVRSCTLIRRFPSTLSSKCPRSRAHPAFLVRLSVTRRRRNSWWKRQLSSLVEVFEQPVDIPVRAWAGTGGRLQGSLPGQSSSSVEQIADTPVPCRGIHGGSEGFHPGQSSTAVAEQIVDLPVPHGGCFLQDPGLAPLPPEVAGEAFQGFFKVRR